LAFFAPASDTSVNISVKALIAMAAIVAQP
jgi:hypothetical protein